MSLFDSLAKKATSEVGDKSAGWVVKETARIKGELPQGDDPESRAVRETAEFALAKLDRNKEAVGRLGQSGATAFFGMLSMGKKLEATRFATDRLTFLRQQASWSELDAAVDTVAAGTNQAKKDQDSAEALARDVGAAAAKTLLPFLLSTAVAVI